MSKWASGTVTVVIIVCCLACRRLDAQPFRLSARLQAAIEASCSLCRAPQQALPRPAQQRCRLLLHRAHRLLQAGAADTAYPYLVALTATPGSCAEQRALATYLEAKVLFYKNIYSAALPLYLQVQDAPGLHPALCENIWANIAACYVEQEQYALALRYFRRWERDGIPYSDPVNTSQVLNNIGVCYLQLDQLRTADRYFQQSFDLARQLADTTLLATLYANAANLYYSQRQDGRAVQYFRRALQLALATRAPDIARQVCGSLAVVAEDHGQLRQALAYRKTFEALSDSLNNADKVWTLARKEQQLLVQQKEYALRLMRQQGRIQELRLSRQRWQRNTVLLVALILLGGAAWMYRAYRQQSSQNRVIAAQREQLGQLNRAKDQLFSIVAHDLRSPVHLLTILLSGLQAALRAGNTGEALRRAEEVRERLGRTYALLNNLLHWALGQTGQLHLVPERLALRQVIDLICYDYTDMAGARNITLQNQVDERAVCTADLNTVKVIFRNLVDNAIRYSYSGTRIVFTAAMTVSGCLVSVRNTGAVLSPELLQRLTAGDAGPIDPALSGSRSTGLGLWLVRTMAGRNNGRLLVASNEHETTMSIQLPYTRTNEQAKHSDPGG